MVISDDARYTRLPPLQRLIQAVRDQSDDDKAMLDMAFCLCEANLAISRHEYEQWHGLCVIDASAVFSANGLGGDLCKRYGYDFWTFLRTLASLGRESDDPAQYHQCINQNLFHSPVDDEVLITRAASLSHGDPRHRGCMVDTSQRLKALESGGTGQIPTPLSPGILRILPSTHPDLFQPYGRHSTMDLAGGVKIKSPFCCNVQLETAFYWLAGIALTNTLGISELIGQAGWLSNSELQLFYNLELTTPEALQLRVILAGTDPRPKQPGQAERYFWMHKNTLPSDGRTGVSITMAPDQWLPLKGHPQEAYGIKCQAVPPEQMDHSYLEIILALDIPKEGWIPEGSLTLPTLELRLRGAKDHSDANDVAAPMGRP